MSNKALPTNGPGRPKDPAKRDAILAAAKALFLRNGYEGSSMDAIAAEARVSKLTVYSHFTDKETLFVTAVKSKSEEQLPPLYFSPPPNSPIETVLLDIGRGFYNLVNSRESVELHRLMMTQAGANSKLAELFFAAGPQRILREMEQLLTQANNSRQLQINNPHNSAAHFLSMIKGIHNLRLLVGCATPQTAEQIEAHVKEVVALFIRAHKPS